MVSNPPPIRNITLLEIYCKPRTGHTLLNNKLDIKQEENQQIWQMRILGVTFYHDLNKELNNSFLASSDICPRWLLITGAIKFTNFA